MKINRRKFLSIGGLSALALSFPASLFKFSSKNKSTDFYYRHANLDFQPTWLQGNPHLGCSYPYFKQNQLALKNQCLEKVHIHMEPNVRDSIIYDIPFKSERRE